MKNQIYKQWIHDWQWILQVAENRQWDIRTPLSILPPCSATELEDLTKESSLILPEEFIQVATEFAAGVSFSWFMSEDNQEHADDLFDEIFSGGAHPLWSIKALKTCKTEYDGWVTECFPNP